MEQHVRVDRKLYEKLLSGESDSFSFNCAQTAAELFHNIMITTGTEITWPCRLRLNTRSRKDPHVRIIGLPAAVEQAKNIIDSLLDTRINRVTLKMDVSFTDHSHVIGKGGRSIQKVMDSTGCHIHFPDGNRTNSYEKSNQVSIAGSALGAEQARCHVRELLPISVHYELPLDVLVQSAVDPKCGPLQTLQHEYGITVTFKPITTFGGFFDVGHVTGVHVIVRGSRAQSLTLQLGISHLLNLLTGGSRQFASTPALIETEIAAQHHAFVMGRANCNLRHITQLTGAVVSFPEPTATYYNMPTPTASSMPNKRSNVKIRGRNFESVYKGWLELMNFLPLLLIFDMPDGKDCDPVLITKLMEELSVSITIKPKQKQSSKSVMVRGPEHQSQMLFEVRRQILDLDHTEVPHRNSDPDSPLWPQNFQSTSHKPPTTAAAVDRPLPMPRMPRADSSGSFIDSRARAPPVTSLSTIFNQQRENTGHRRLDTIDSVSTDASNDYSMLYRSFLENDKPILSESFVADEVFASSLTHQDFSRLSICRESDEDEMGSGDMMQPSSEFGAALSQTFPKHMWKRAASKRPSLPIENIRGMDSECVVS